MKCKCGNEMGKKLVSPPSDLIYMAGMSTDGRCWFCCTTLLGGDDFKIVREKARALGAEIPLEV